MLWPVVILAALTLSSNGCAAKHITPEPLYGKDVQKVISDNNGGFKAVDLGATNYDGMYFSNFYLNEYLQWKCKNESKC